MRLTWPSTTPELEGKVSPAVTTARSLHAHPELRLCEASAPREHGLLLGPALIVLVVIAAVSSVA
jgi:hypothetical protein